MGAMAAADAGSNWALPHSGMKMEVDKKLGWQRPCGKRRKGEQYLQNGGKKAKATSDIFEFW